VRGSFFFLVIAAMGLAPALARAWEGPIPGRPPELGLDLGHGLGVHLNPGVRG